MTKRITKLVAGLAALAALALGGSAIAGAVQNNPGGAQATQAPAEPAGSEPAEAAEEKGEQATGAEADRAKQAALDSTGGGEATSVERDEPEGAEQEEPGEKAGEDRQEGYQSPAGSAWEVEVTKSGGQEVEVYLDKDFKVLDTAPAEQD